MAWAHVKHIGRLVATAFLPAHYFVTNEVRQAIVVAVRDETPDVRTLIVRPARGWRRHRAGQHVRVSLELDGRIATRMYAIASAEDRLDGCIELAVKARGRVSNALARELAPGARLGLGLPEGDFVYAQGAPVRTLFVTGGIGIAPVASMLRTFAARGAMPDVVHVHRARDRLFLDELRAIEGAHPSYRLALPDGRFTLDELAPDWRAREAWVCAPPELLAPIAAAFDEAGRAHALRIERFAAPVVAVPPDAGDGGVVAFGAGGPRVRAGARTPLLHVAESAGLAIAHGCRMGVCHTCDTTMVSGRVRDLRTGAVIDEPGARIQVCVCAAAGDVELAL